MDFAVKRMYMPLIVACCIFTFLVCMLFIQAGHIVSIEKKRKAESVLDYAESILDEARLAAQEMSGLVESTCTELIKNELDNIVAGYPHLHSMVITGPKGIRCSSLSGEFLPDASHRNTATQALALHTFHDPGNRHTQPLLVKTFHGHNGMILDIAISGIFLKNNLKTDASGYPLYLQIGDMQLSASGEISPVKSVGHSLHHSSSKESSLSIFYSSALGLSLLSALLMFPFTLSASLILSILSGLAYYLIIKKTNTPGNDLLAAIKNGDIKTFYQPIVNAADGEIVGFEALCRWYHPSEGIISPNLFIPMAEKSGLIVRLTQYQLNQISRDLITLSPGMNRPFHISVNFSQRHCAAGTFIHDCKAFIRKIATFKVTLIIEITERHPMLFTDVQMKKFAWLKQNGVQLSLDDFGTGYSNLEYISELIPDYLKIDRMFVNSIGSGNTVLLDCVTEMVDKLGIKAIAEGVENISQARYLQDRGVQYQQGYYWYHPMDFTTLLQTLSGKTRQR